MNYYHIKFKVCLIEISIDLELIIGYLTELLIDGSDTNKLLIIDLK